VVDGKDVSDGPCHDLEILPGKHHISGVYRKELPLCGSVGCIVAHRAILSLTFSAEAGHEYRVLADDGSEGIDYIWVEDEVTGEIVAGGRPPDGD